MLHDHDRDELRRALRDAEAAQREAMPRFREALKRLFTPDSPHARADRGTKALLLGVPVPDRRGFLRSGGLAVAGAVVLAACSDDGGSAGGTGTTVPPPTGRTGGEGEPGPNAGDIDLVIAAIQIEHTAVAVYDAVAEARAEDLQAAGVAEAALLFRDHHAEHADALDGLLDDNDVEPVADDELFAGIPLLSDEDLASLPTGDIAAFARGLENQAAQTYITTVPRLSLPGIRQTLLSIASVEAKHVAAFDLVLGGGVMGYLTTTQLVIGGNYPTNESFLNG